MGKDESILRGISPRSRCLIKGNMMKNQPKEIMIATIEVLVMPNGNIVSYGKIIGKFEDFKKYLKNIRKAN